MPSQSICRCWCKLGADETVFTEEREVTELAVGSEAPNDGGELKLVRGDVGVRVVAADLGSRVLM